MDFNANHPWPLVNYIYVNFNVCSLNIVEFYFKWKRLNGFSFLHNQARVLSEDSRWSRVAACVPAAQAQKPPTPSSTLHCNLLACFHHLAGFYDDAKSDFEQALKLKPDFEDAKVSLHQTIVDQQHRLTRGYWGFDLQRAHRFDHCSVSRDMWKCK